MCSSRGAGNYCSRHSVLRTCCKARHYCPQSVHTSCMRRKSHGDSSFIHSIRDQTLSRSGPFVCEKSMIRSIPLLNLDTRTGLGEAGWLFSQWDRLRIPYPRHVKIWRKSKGSVCQGVGVKQAVSSWLGKDHPYSLCFVGTVVQLGSSPVLDF